MTTILEDAKTFADASQHYLAENERIEREHETWSLRMTDWWEQCRKRAVERRAMEGVRYEDAEGAAV